MYSYKKLNMKHQKHSNQQQQIIIVQLRKPYTLIDYLIGCASPGSITEDRNDQKQDPQNQHLLQQSKCCTCRRFRKLKPGTFVSTRKDDMAVRRINRTTT